MFNRIVLSTLMIAAVAFAGCSDDDTVTGPASSTAFVRVAHLSPDAPAVDVWVDGTRVLRNVPFKAFSSYLQVPAGNRQVQVTPAGATTPVVINAALDVSAGTYYTVAATGVLASIAPTVLVDDPLTDKDAARIRFIHAGPDAPPVDITLTDGTVLFGNVAFTGSRDFITTPAGSYDLQVRVAGTDTVVLTFNDVTLTSGSIYSVFASGLISGGSLGAVVAVDAPGDGSTTISLP